MRPTSDHSGENSVQSAASTDLPSGQDETTEPTPATFATRPLESWEEPASVRWTPAYLKRLLIERHAIRARLENPGGSLIVSPARKAETDAVTDYSSVIGNDFHLDLLSAEQEVAKLGKGERDSLLAWCDGLSSREAAQFAGIRPGALDLRRSRVTKKIAENLNGEVSRGDG